MEKSMIKIGDDGLNGKEILYWDGELPALIDWIKKHDLSKVSGTTSYGKKHTYEKETGIYVTNGSFILAALICGYEIDTKNTEGLNAYFKKKKQPESEQSYKLKDQIGFD